jgi:beta-lactamase regulating signal transducer with metallopeptidase domain
MNISTTYLLNVALHAAVLSVFASLVLMALRHARHRSVAAIAGLVAVGFLPWLTALRPAQPIAAAAPKIQAQHEAPALPTWTVVTLPAPQKVIPAPTEPAAAPAKFVFPDPLHTLVILWATGAGVGLLLLTIATLKVGRWRKSLVPLDTTAWQSLQTLSSELPAQRHFLLCKSTASPCVTGLLRPRIVLPKFLLDSGSENELRWALRHEIAHWQAGDSRWMILFALIRCTNWWNPLVHRLVSQWSEAREQLCDLHATSVSENRADYGEFLIAMARKVTSQPPLAVAMAKRQHARRLRQRIVSLLSATATSDRPAGKGFIVASAAIFIACSAIASSMRVSAEDLSGENRATTDATIQQPEEKPVAETQASPSEKPPTPGASEEVSKVMKTLARLVMTKTKPVLKDGSILTEDEIQLYMKSISTNKDSTLMTAPSVASRFGHNATMEISREVPGTAQQIAARNPGAPVPVVGIVFKTGGEIVGDQAKITFDAAYHFIPGAYEPTVDSQVAFPIGLDPDKIKTLKRTVSGRLGARQVLYANLGELEPGKFLQLFIQVTPLDSAGKELPKFRSPANAASSPSADVRGKLRLTGYQIDVPADSIHYSSSPYGLTSTDAGSEQRWKSIPMATIKAYAPLEIPFNEISRPWDIPNLKVSAIGSSDFKLTSLKNYEPISTTGEPFGESITFDDFENGQWMHIGVKTDNPKIARRVFFQIEAIP